MAGDGASLEAMNEYFNTPFFWGLASGLGVGLVVAAWAWVAGYLKRRDLRNDMAGRLQAVNDEVEKLRQHLHTQMQITAKGADEREKQLGELKAQNENLRVMVQGLQQKPERATARTLEVWQRAVERMTGRAPGFAQAWQQAVAEAEAEVAEAEGGLSKFVRKFLGTGKAQALPAGAATASAEETPAEGQGS
jgi:TolA-binding protein